MVTIRKMALSLILASTFLTGCATIVGGGSEQEVNFNSNPEGASIWIGKIKKGEIVDLADTGKTTPQTMKISRKNVVIILKKEGYKDTNVIMKQTTNGWFWGNIVLGGLIGSSVDFSTGANMKYDPDNFFLELEAE